jgi:alkylhydroperoxidase/carboxymuconolactone decarboxylase family protein YurZ
MNLPAPYIKFQERYPDLARDFEALGHKCRESGPLGARDICLVKLGMAVATGSKGGIKSQARKALEEGLPPQELLHAAVLALPTIGFPAMVAAMGWIDDTINE